MKNEIDDLFDYDAIEEDSVNYVYFTIVIGLFYLACLTALAILLICL